MNSVEKPLVYVILGAADSGRREVLCDLIEGGLGEDAQPARDSAWEEQTRPTLLP